MKKERSKDAKMIKVIFCPRQTKQGFLMEIVTRQLIGFYFQSQLRMKPLNNVEEVVDPSFLLNCPPKPYLRSSNARNIQLISFFHSNELYPITCNLLEKNNTKQDKNRILIYNHGSFLLRHYYSHLLPSVCLTFTAKVDSVL